MKTKWCVCILTSAATLASASMAMGAVTASGAPALQQDSRVKSNKFSGQVVDAKTGEPIIGVTVKVKGTNIGTVTDIDGRFSINAAGKSPILMFSYVGYSPQEVKPTAGNMEIRLKEDSMQLDEVVVVGFGVQKKSLVTGAISSVKGSELEMTGIMRADDALQGKTSGVQIISNSGQPGTSTSIRVRGVGTNGTAQPIYIVDGMTVGDIEYLNPADIESIEVLKDAASSAIYGARGGNGVILITTKNGSEGKTLVSANFSYGIQNIAHKVNVLNAKEYCILQNEAAQNGGQALPFTQEQIDHYNRGTDWQEAVLNRNAPIKQG